MERWRRTRTRTRRRDAGEAEERISGDSMRGEPYVEERASQPDRAASLAGCTEGRQLPAGLPPPRIIRHESETESERGEQS